MRSVPAPKLTYKQYARLCALHIQHEDWVSYHLIFLKGVERGQLGGGGRIVCATAWYTPRSVFLTSPFRAIFHNNTSTLLACMPVATAISMRPIGPPLS